MNLSDSVKTIASAIAIVTFIVTTGFTIDNRYALAGDLDKVTQTLDQTKKETKALLNDHFKQQRIEALRDKIFDIQVKGAPSDVDRARLTRYQYDLNLLIKQ